MRNSRTARASVWAALALQFAGLIYDGLWHGLLHPGAEPTTFADMRAHLASVHLVIYLGVLSVLITTGWALLERRSWAVVAFAGAVLSTVGEAWHASIHLRLSTHGGPIAEGVATIGFVIVALALWVGGRRERHRLPVPKGSRRAA